MLLNDKAALVTGAAAGIGAGVAELFAQNGARVALLDVNGAGAEGRAAGLREKGGEAFAIQADVRNCELLQAAVDETVSRFGAIDILINNAGIYPRQPFLDITEQQWDDMQAVNLKAIFQLSKFVLPHMIRKRSGHIVNISSVTFFVGPVNLAHYVASKGGVVGLTRALAREIGEYGIHVNCITPGAVETEGEKSLNPTREQIDAIVERQSFRRRILPIDIARVCLFLSSELCSGMTGQTLNVDGGWVLY